MSRSKNRKRQNQRKRANQKRSAKVGAPPPPTIASRLLEAKRFVQESFTPPPDYSEKPSEPLRWYNLRRHEVSVLVVAAMIALASLIVATATRADPVSVVERDSIAFEAMIHINNAPAETLRVIPGVGEITSQRIVKERESRGPFASLQEMGERVERFSVKRAKTFERYLDFSTPEE